ncbi:hypothetical protein HU200_032210 [Digitaria exilis]|uniref:F-box/LRR-repeat protein 15/At3g58940/PEG3-like LRR domain-containing protein n=1 Tax=Digitaria exilis TaxID=1010633 RepID=A0A835EP57_9POAL|nr:hypothetical protein HU200_032210 [Digitaria exilis]
MSLRSFTVGFNYFYGWDVAMVESWVAHALQQSSAQDGFHLDLRLHAHHKQCQQGAEKDDPYAGFHDRDQSQRKWGFRFPSSLFSCAALRSLRLGHCLLNPPGDTALPSLETLHLTGAHDSDEAIHLLIARCPRLDDVTLESCSELTRVSVPGGMRLRRFSLRCCHKVASVALDTSRLRALDYRGAVPSGSLFTFHGGDLSISSGTVGFCGPSCLSTGEEHVGLCRLLGDHFVTAKHLHLASRRLGCSIESGFFPCLPLFSRLHKLELTGCVDRGTTVYAVPRILQQTPNLEVLTLFLTPAAPDVDKNPDVDERSDVDESLSNYRLDEYPLATIPRAHEVSCLRQRLREINLVHYQGTDDEAMLAKLLLRNALVLQDLSVVFPKRSQKLQTGLMDKIKHWVVSKSTKITFQ